MTSISPHRWTISTASCLKEARTRYLTSMRRSSSRTFSPGAQTAQVLERIVGLTPSKLQAHSTGRPTSGSKPSKLLRRTSVAIPCDRSKGPITRDLTLEPTDLWSSRETISRASSILIPSDPKGSRSRCPMDSAVRIACPRAEGPWYSKGVGYSTLVGDDKGLLASEALVAEGCPPCL